MSNVKFSQLPNLGTPTANTIIPVVAGVTNYTVTAANLQAFVNNSTGNIQGNYILGNGSQLTGLPATYSNSNVVTLMAAFGSNTVSTTGNITGSYVLGNGSQLTGLPATYGNANVTTLLAAFGSNTISTTGNITASYVLGNGSQLTGLPATYGNANVTTLLAAFGSNSISTSGNVSANNISLTGNIYYNGSTNPVGLGRVNPTTGNVSNASAASLTFNIPAAGVWSINCTVNASINKNTASPDYLIMGLFDSSNIQIGNSFTVVNSSDSAARLYNFAASGSGQYIVTTTGAATYYANAVSASGVVSSSAFGTYSQLNSPVVMESISYTGNLNYAGNITANAGNVIASNYLVGNALVVNGDGSLNGNVTGNYFIGNGSQLTGLPATYGNANVATFMAAFGSNAVSTTGNVSASYHIGNGSLLTGITASGGTSIVNGTSNVSISSANGNISFVTTGNTVMQIVANRNYPYVGIVSNVAMEIPSLYCYNDITNPGGSTVLITGAGAGNVSSGTVTADIVGISTGGRLQLPINTAAQTRLVTTGSIAGQIRAVSDSPTVHGRLCFWDSTNSRWSYVSDNTAV